MYEDRPERARGLAARFGWALGLLGLALSGAAEAVSGAPAGTLDPDERVIFFPTYGCRVDADTWELVIHGWVYERERLGRVLAGLVGRFEVDGRDLDAEDRARVSKRVSPFLVDNERRERVRIRIAGEEVELQPSGADGHVIDRIRLSEARVRALRRAGELPGGWLSFALIAPPGVPAATGRVQLLGERGLSVISDIDDTIKVSDVADREQLARRTFLLPFEPVPGMSERYRGWADRRAAFHYVSESPWPLYEPLAEFLAEKGFPAGTFHLQDFRLMGKLLASEPARHERKTERIRALLADFPRRQFVLVGDSGEEDPEIYAALARQYPKQIVHIFIRALDGSDATAARYQETFAGLPAKRWTVFQAAQELPARLR